MTAIEKRRLGEGVYGKGRINYVYADSRERFENAFGSRYPVRYGDRILVRVCKGGRSVKEFYVNEVCDFTELYGEIRKATKEIRGLVELHLRNYKRGWSVMRPLKLYSSSAVMPTPSTSRHASPERRMLCPWETH